MFIILMEKIYFDPFASIDDTGQPAYPNGLIQTSPDPVSLADDRRVLQTTNNLESSFVG